MTRILSKFYWKIHVHVTLHLGSPGEDYIGTVCAAPKDMVFSAFFGDEEGINFGHFGIE